MNHRIFLQHAIVAVIAILILWSIVNVATYAYIYHANWIVWTLGIAIGAANAISVYAFVIAGSNRQRWPAGVGIVLFGGASGVLQMLLYTHDGAPPAAAIPFGWIGPVAEGVLSWLHAALSELAPAAKTASQKVQRKTAKLQPEKLQEVAGSQVQKVQSEVQEIAIRPGALEALGMQENGMSIAEIAAQLRKSERTVSNYLKQAKGHKVAIHANGHTAEVQS